jgi:dTMP kinase
MPFIVFEGLDGCGKSTLLASVHNWLLEKRIDAVSLREPGSTVLGEYLRSLLLAHKTGPMTPWAELLLFTAARAEMVKTVVQPALLKGQVVLLDRYLYSTLAYQGYGFELDNEAILRTNLAACGGLLPDLVCWCRVSTATAMKRRGKAPDRMESRDLQYLERVCLGYETLASLHRDRFLDLDGEQSAEMVFHQASSALERKFGWTQ